MMGTTVMIVLLCFLLLPLSSALFIPSNESIQAKEVLDQSKSAISEMVSKNISILRVNESYQQALQVYTAQLALEEDRGMSDYGLVIEYASKVISIKKIAIEADDELRIFKKSYASAEKDSNLSEMQTEYNQIIISFQEERFEDTRVLIDKGYTKISEIQSSQTVVNAVYLATSKTIKNFFINNWMKIVIISTVIIILLVIFRITLIKIGKRMRLNHLVIQKKAINTLIKELQASYFKTKSISDNEYNIKLKKYEELIRDIDREKMVLEEEIYKLNSKAKR